MTDNEQTMIVRLEEQMKTVVDTLKEIRERLDEGSSKFTENAVNIAKMQTELRIIKWVGGAAGAALITLLIERISKLL